MSKDWYRKYDKKFDTDRLYFETYSNVAHE